MSNEEQLEIKESYELGSSFIRMKLKEALKTYAQNHNIEIAIYKNDSVTLSFFVYRTITNKKWIFTFKKYYLRAKFEYIRLGRFTPTSHIYFYTKDNESLVLDIHTTIKDIFPKNNTFKDLKIYLDGYTEPHFVNQLLEKGGSVRWNSKEFALRQVKIKNGYVLINGQHQ